MTHVCSLSRLQDGVPPLDVGSPADWKGWLQELADGEYQWPSDYLLWLKRMNRLPPQLQALVGLPQDHLWHPEGWSASERTCESLPLRSSGTGTTHPFGTNDGLGLRKFVSRPLAKAARKPLFAGTTVAQPAVPFSSLRLAVTDRARQDGSSASATLGETILAKSVTLVPSVTRPTAAADKIFRIVTKIPVSGVRAIMVRPINDFEVVKAIVLSVAVYVMDVLVGQKPTTEFQLLEEPVQADIPRRLRFRRGDVDVDIPVIVVDFERGPVDDHIVFDFDLAVVRNVDVHDGSPSRLCTPTGRHFQVSIGDAFVHTCQTVDAMSDICKRENIRGERRAFLLLTMVCHDLGKATTTVLKDGRWRSPGHDLAGIEPARQLVEFTQKFSSMFSRLSALVRWHMSHCRKDFSQKSVRKLARELQPSNIVELLLVMESDCMGRGSASSGLPEPVVFDLVLQAKTLGLLHG